MWDLFRFRISFLILLLNQGMSVGRIVTILFGIVCVAASKMEFVIRSADVSKLSLFKISCQFTELSFDLNSA